MRNKRTNTYVGHIAESNLYEPDLHLAIHSNAGNARGCEVLCYDPTNLSSLGTKLAHKLYARLSTLTPPTDRGIKSGKDTVSEIRDTHAPAVLSEVSFHDNPEDAAWIVSHISEIAKAHLLSILEIFNITYKPIIPLPTKEELLWGALKRIKLIADEALR